MTNNKQQITKEELAEFAKLLNQKHATAMADKFFEVAHAQKADEVTVIVTLRNTSDSFHYPVEARVLADAKMSPKDCVAFLLDYIDMYWEEFFKEGGELYLPIDWSDHAYEGVDFQIRGQIHNLMLEKMGDDFLEQHTH